MQVIHKLEGTVWGPVTCTNYTGEATKASFYPKEFKGTVTSYDGWLESVFHSDHHTASSRDVPILAEYCKVIRETELVICYVISKPSFRADYYVR